MSFRSGVSVFLRIDKDSERIDVTTRHIFLGYKPVVIGVIIPDTILHWKGQQDVTLEFYHGDEQIAFLLLRKDRSVPIGNSTVFFYQAIRGSHSFINHVHRLINQLRQGLRKATPSNIALQGNLYDQVRIAYCVPRVISVITVGTENSMNMFPTDLHGPVTENFYLSSLRIGSAATQQVERLKKIVLSDVEASVYRAVYDLGRNHMREPTSRDAFACSDESEYFHTPLPTGIVSYRELKLVSSFDIGIHRIHIYRIISAKKNDGASTLAHIHAYYAQWRLDRNIPTDMLIR
jgi:hypothetical protein